MSSQPARRTQAVFDMPPVPAARSRSAGVHIAKLLHRITSEILRNLSESGGLVPVGAGKAVALIGEDIPCATIRLDELGAGHAPEPAFSPARYDLTTVAPSPEAAGAAIQDLRREIHLKI